jgi:branched-chain amino acid transport system substrate-binding protein
MHRWRLVPTMLVMLVALLLGGCAADESAGDAPAGAQAGPIKIGVDIELSGPASVQGEAYQRAVQLVADQVNAKGGVLGRKVELSIRDNKSDPAEALQVAKSLVERDGVVGIVGGGSTPTTLSIADFVESGQIPTVSMGSSGQIVNPPDRRRFVFKTPATTGQVIEVMAKDMAARGIKRIALLSVNNAYGDAGLDGLTDAAPANGLELVASEKFEATDRDFSTQVTKLKAAKPDAMVVWAIPPGAGIAAKNAKDLDLGKPVYFDAGAGAELFLRGAGDAAEGVFMVHPKVLVADQVTAAPNKQVMDTFYQEYTARHGSYSGFASYAADALNLLLEAITKAGGTDRVKVRDALEQLSYSGITGEYRMAADNHTGLATDALTVVTVRDGKWAPADTAS